MTKKKVMRMGKSWICDACAKRKGLEIPKHGMQGVTCIAGLCGHCKSSVFATLIPVCDYNDPKTRRKAVWD